MYSCCLIYVKKFPKKLDHDPELTIRFRIMLWIPLPPLISHSVTAERVVVQRIITTQQPQEQNYITHLTIYNTVVCFQS